MKWGEFFKAGGASGFSPQQVRAMSIWEFLMCIEGWKNANGVGSGDGKLKPPSEDEFMDAVNRLADQPVDWNAEV